MTRKPNSIPLHTNAYNVYLDGDKLIGVDGDFEAPSLEAMTSTVSGPGVLGEIDMPNIGNFGSMDMTLKFRSVDSEAGTLFEPGTHDVTLRANQGRHDSATGKPVNSAIRVVVRGVAKNLETGTFKGGEGTGTSVSLEILYIKIEVDGFVLVELDKLNYIFVVNGKDYMAEIRNNI